MPQSSARPPREIFINVDFDLSLRRGWKGQVRERIARQIRDLVPTFLIAGPASDTLLVHEPVPDSFLDYLGRKGVEHLTPTPITSRDPVRKLTPFGWNAESDRLAAEYDQPPARPPLDVVRTVNSRRFSARLESSLFGEQPWSGAFETLEALEERLATTDSPSGQWLVKASHGNAGLGNRRLAGASLSQKDRAVLAALLEEDGCLFLEPWRERLADLCVVFDLEAGGDVENLGFHEIVNTAGGSFIGALYGDPSPALEKWGGDLEEVARTVAAVLGDAGYFGPVCIDAFTHMEGSQERLRALVDLNARWNISAPAQARHRRDPEDAALLYRFFAPKDFASTGEPEDFDQRLGSRAFDPGTGRGILLSSPLSFGSGALRRFPHKVGVVFHGSCRRELLAMDRDFREEFQR